MSEKEPVAPSLEDLSYVHVEGSRFFGLTNVTGKILSLASFTTLAMGSTGLAQGLGYLGRIAGMSLSLGAGFALTGASVVTGLIGYWMGNFDDKRIKKHNERAAGAFAAARGTMYQKIENGFIQALSKIEYDPGKNSLPHDALGHAVLFSDDKIAKLPPHIQVDVYRTQIDLELFRHRRIISGATVEGAEFESRTMVDGNSMNERALAYKRCRDHIRDSLRKGTLVCTPLGGKNEKPEPEGSGFTSGDGTAGDVADDFLDGLGRSLRHLSGGSSGGGFKGGGGNFGGGGAGGSWGDAVRTGGNAVSVSGRSAQPQPFIVPGLMGAGNDISPAGAGMSDSFNFGSVSGSGSGGGSGPDFDLDLGDMDEDAAKILLPLAAAAAVIAAASVSVFSLWKNYVSRADKPVLGHVPLPMISKSLASVEKDVRMMYNPA